MLYDLQDRVALVTGATSGIGLAVARTLSTAGARVISTDAAEDRLADLPDGLSGAAFALDVTQPEAWAAAAERVNEAHGRLDILVNNAGVICNRTFLSTDFAEFRRLMSINVEGVWLGLQTFAPLLMVAGKDGGASVVNMSSVYGLVGSPSNAAYSATKGAVRLLTKSVAAEFAQRRTGVRVNSVHPGPTETPLLTDGFEDVAQRRKTISADDVRQAVTAMIPMGRLGEVNEIASAVLFLASPMSNFMTGSELVIDGGYTCI